MKASKFYFTQKHMQNNVERYCVQYWTSHASVRFSRRFSQLVVTGNAWSVRRYRFYAGSRKVQRSCDTSKTNLAADISKRGICCKMLPGRHKVYGNSMTPNWLPKRVPWQTSWQKWSLESSASHYVPHFYAMTRREGVDSVETGATPDNLAGNQWDKWFAFNMFLHKSIYLISHVWKASKV